MLNDTTWQFKLREGVKFHNGEPFDADDVVFTLNWISNPGNGVKVQRNVNWIDRAEKVDQYTVNLHMKKPFPQAFEFLSGPLTIYPNEYYAESGPEGMGQKPVGTDPMKVVSTKTADRAVTGAKRDLSRPRALAHATSRSGASCRQRLSRAVYAGRKGAPPPRHRRVARRARPERRAHRFGPGLAKPTARAVFVPLRSRRSFVPPVSIEPFEPYRVRPAPGERTPS